MLHILDSVASKREIQMKKVKLYNSLSRMGIEEININFFSEENQQYNTVTAETYQFNCDAIETNKGDEYIKNCTYRINQINIIRKNKNHTLREAGSVLLTSNGTILKCAYMPNAFTEGDAPKAVNIDYLINRFWYKLNKGFGKGDEPKSIDIISRARIALASMSNSKVSQTYDEIRKQYSDGNITEMEVAGIISELRKVSRNPEDITPDQIDNQIAFLKDYDLEQRIEDVRREELARKKDKETITELRQYINQNEKKQTQLEQEHLERDIQFEKRIKALEEEKSTIEAEKAELYRTVEYYINRDKKKRQTFHRVMRGLIFLIVLIIIAMLLFMGCSYLLKIDRSISGVISILLTLLFQFAKPMKRLWQRFVFEYQLKE